ncbi:hypothetical protein A2335_02565 [Candidatus Peregrinibacteria bacterium RIFOXYB2_FULL_32_7]|nr:MAG: hypothetical protein A2335_02565 [Candidatus Peregrinibacteria bacterium RIFOXYB2_FULL_32_7]
MTMILATVFLAGCSMLSLKEPTKQIENNNEQKLSFTAQINQSLNNSLTIEEIDNPNLTLPSDINTGQIKKYFKIDNILFALVLRNSMNVVLSLPTDFTPTFTGVLVAGQGNPQWTKLIEIKDTEETNKNNPYYLMVDNQKLLLTIVDQNGAGSGEGIMKVFALQETSNWKLESCYYFGGNYNDPSTDSDYFAFSTKFSKHTSQPIESCNNVQLVFNE